MKNAEAELLGRLWRDVAGTDGEGRPSAMGAPPPLSLGGEDGGLPSVFHVSAFATACVAVATLAASELLAARTGESPRAVHVDRRHAAVAFRSERHVRTVTRPMPPVWDPLSGDYTTRSGVIRLHTNYAHHRAAALRALSLGAEEEDREVVRRRLLELTAEDVEREVVLAGGAAAKLRTRDEWRAHPQGRAVAKEPLVFVRRALVSGARPLARAGTQPPKSPLAGVRVLDVTRVIAGPVCTRVLAAHGAEVLRIDPPGFHEVEALLGDTTSGKRCAALDLKSHEGRARFLDLCAGADVLVHGLRSDAFSRLGLSTEELLRHNPALVVVTHDAYGFSGPWSHRRGFDSLVQLSCGIAARGQEALSAAMPVPLPAQALDHGTGYLLAAAACRALTRAHTGAEISLVQLSLARTAELLMSLGDDGDPRAADLPGDAAAPWVERVPSAFGPIDRVRCPGSIEGLLPAWKTAPGPLCIAAPSWEPVR